MHLALFPHNVRTESYQTDINIILDGMWPWLFEFGDWLRHAHCSADQIQAHILYVNMIGYKILFINNLSIC